ncbi:hypothetical protein VTJ83DRAFT_2403 [Remersonia thermophila]|uniref:Uncharacterized protein n=1 Tax=Remersonia thermophila TaxID=72144 RepID=A0ABR4DIS5_9PEZI
MLPVRRIRPDKEPVPGYRFHHVEISKNVLALNSMLNFVPHLRDVDPNSVEEQKYAAWLMDLENLDSKSGFQIQNRKEKMERRVRNEFAAALAPYLEPWLRKLAIDGCTKSTLIRYMASQPQNEDAITPQQKTNLLDTHGDTDSPHAARAARLFTEAFDRVFNAEANPRRVALRDILLLDKTVEPILDNKRAKDGPGSQRPRDEALMQKVSETLGSYSALGCLICFSHDCEHGEIERDNQKRCFSLEEIGGLAPTLRRKWAMQLEAQQASEPKGITGRAAHQPCRNECYRLFSPGPEAGVEPWSENEVGLLECMFAAVGYSTSLTPQCFVAAVLGRPCWDVHRKLGELELSLPHVEPRVPKKPKPVPWYDRKKKQLLGDWQDATITHEHAVRELFAPCHHDGPCTADNGCPCASGGSHPVLCERFCLCTAEDCALKFTGCACHSSGKTCLVRQKEGRPCICVQLNRECDPVLCKGCGAKERADPENAYDEQLHATGCQNVAMQRGVQKALLMGKSQLEACGYGLFAAEDIAQDDFVIEYTGELISHDEGVRRENRRGDVFDEENKVSYLFTLLEQEGIWVDAAMYGNLSRYINHASNNCNIMPRIMYVNHEFRIKFIALRDIKAGEELFFNYGDNFPNLTKKLVERNDLPGGKRNGGAGPKRKGAGGQGPAARKSTSRANRENVNDAPGDDFRNGGPPVPDDDDNDDDDDDDNGNDNGDDDDDDVGDEWANRTPRRRKKRGGRRPGAGRKKKQPVPSVDPPAPARVTPGSGRDEASPSRQLRTESRSAQKAVAAAAAAAVATSATTTTTAIGTTTATSSLSAPASTAPTGRRTTKRSYLAMLNPGLSLTATGPSGELVKKPSRRGGARPGAGRKPKHRPPGLLKAGQKLAAAKAGQTNNGSSNSNNKNDNAKDGDGNNNNNNTSNDDSNKDTPTIKPDEAETKAASTPTRTTRSGAGVVDPKDATTTTTTTTSASPLLRSSAKGTPPTSSSTTTTGVGRKRKAADLDSASNTPSTSNLRSHAVFRPIDDAVELKPGSGSSAPGAVERRSSLRGAGGRGGGTTAGGPSHQSQSSIGSGNGSGNGSGRAETPGGRAGSSGAGEDEGAAGEGAADRSARKRQKPLRYRNEEE